MEEVRSLQGETIPFEQPEDIGIGFGEPVFLQAEEEIGIHQTIQDIRGDFTPIVQEQQQLRQELQEIANEATLVLYNTAAFFAQSLNELRQATGTALYRAENAIGQVGV